MRKRKTVSFFSTVRICELEKEQYSVQDIRILRELGYEVIISDSFWKIPLGCDIYFSWWASGSVLSMIKARVCGKPNIVVAGGNEAMFYRDSVSNRAVGYLNMPFYKKIATRLTLSFSTAIIVVSKFMLPDVRRLGANNPTVIPNCVDTTLFNIIKSDRRFITTIFRLDQDSTEIKRGEVFVRSIPLVVSQFPSQKFVIIGEKGNYFSTIKKIVDNLGISSHVIFTGGIRNEQVVDWLQQSKIYVQISDTETFGVAIAEAMSCGTPVVVSRRGAIPELVGSLGEYVDHNVPNSLSEAVIKLLNKNDDELEEIGLALRSKIVNEFSYERRRDSIRNLVQCLRKEVLDT